MRSSTHVRRVAAAFLMCIAGLAQAIEPLPGMWSFEGELTGKPGRGFQIDSQGGALLILTYIGYRGDGTALFLQATGLREGDRFEADLLEYRGGTPLGAAHRDGQVAANLGRVLAVFDSPSHGTITLPGEAARPVRRFQYEDFSERLNHRFVVRKMVREGNGTVAQLGAETVMKIRAADGLLEIDESAFGMDGIFCRYRGRYEPAGRGVRATGSMVCADQAPVPLRIEHLAVDDDGYLTGSIRYQIEGYPEQTRYWRGPCAEGAALGSYLTMCLLK